MAITFAIIYVYSLDGMLYDDVEATQLDNDWASNVKDADTVWMAHRFFA